MQDPPRSARRAWQQISDGTVPAENIDRREFVDGKGRPRSVTLIRENTPWKQPTFGWGGKRAGSGRKPKGAA